MTTATEILTLFEIQQGQAQKEVTHNTALRQLESRLVRVLDRDLTSAPSSPSDGDTYILLTTVPVATTADTWDGASKNDLILRKSGAWDFYSPIEGLRLWVNDEDLEVVFESSNWVDSNMHDDTQTLSNATTGVSWNMDLGRFADLTLSTSHTINTPTNLNNGGHYTLLVKQAAAGNRLLNYSSAFQWPGSSAPVISTGTNDLDILEFVSDGSLLFGKFEQNFST